MRDYIRFLISFLLITLLLPLVVVTIGGELSERLLEKDGEETAVSVVLKYGGGTEKIAVDEYIAGAIAPAIDFCDEEEFLKAMAILCRTFIVYCKESGLDYTKELDFAKESDMKAMWGESYEAKYEKLKKAAYDTSGCYITAEGSAIYPYIHMCTSGYTRKISGSNKNYSEKERERGELFLCEADGTKDSLEDSYIDQKFVNKTAFVAGMKAVYPDISMNEYEPQNDIQILEKTKGGYVINIQVGNIIMDGDSFAEAFGLKSPAFSIRQVGDEICFGTKGEGCGYGLSLAGAKRMAAEGETAKEICGYYFANVSFAQ